MNRFRLKEPPLCIFVTLLFAVFAMAGDASRLSVWRYVDLLDAQTKAELITQEKFFSSLFQLPAEYTQGSLGSKNEVVKRWISVLRSAESDKIAEVAAYLSITKTKEAAKAVTSALKAGKCNGRARWVCTRALGQIGNKSSVPVLIDLLDDHNWNTRFYARVALAEITGVYFGADKQKWKAWQAGESLRLCTAEECESESSSRNEKSPKGEQSELLSFHLPDAFGRIVDSNDYKGFPVLIFSGACWCGGCQQDAERVREIAAKYGPKGLGVIRTVAGDGELAALDFQRHYRLNFPQLMDTNRTFEKRYNRDGWTFLLLADSQSTVVYKTNVGRRFSYSDLTSRLDGVLANPATSNVGVRDGTGYLPRTLQRTDELENARICDRFASLAAARDDKLCCVFTTNRNGNSDVFLRVFDGNNWSADMPLAATDADEYDATIVVDRKNRCWVGYTSNADGKNYNIFVTSFSNPTEPTKLVQITQADDDAMHARMACDRQGGIWLTYYKWHKMGARSRDKEVYLRRFENGEWSREVQISPKDVPVYEDHTDPVISAYRDGVIVAWSWDFHPPLAGYSKYAENPTIFMRSVTRTMKLGKVFSVGNRGIDGIPAVGVCGGTQIWCTWDTIDWNWRKTVAIANPQLGRDTRPGRIKSMSVPVANVCTPTFAARPDGGLTVVWSERTNEGQWLLRRADFSSGDKGFSPAETIESQGNPRYCSAAYDSNGRLWVAFSAQTDRGVRVVARSFGGKGSTSKD